MKRLELEAALEDRCVAKVEALGGLALKLSIPGVRGFPDRTVLLDKRVWFIEIKRMRTGRVSAQQRKWAADLLRAGFPVFLVDTDTDFDRCLANIWQGVL
jgi:hypothetical protein